MKTMMTLIAAGFFAATSFGDKTFVELEKLANTPASQITTANAVSILDAAVAVTNRYAIDCLTASGKISFADIFAKTKSNPLFVYQVKNAATAIATEAERIEALNDFTDVWPKIETSFRLFGDYIVVNRKDNKFLPAEVSTRIAEKIAASGNTTAGVSLATLLYTYGGNGRDKATLTKYFPEVKASIFNGSFQPCFMIFDVFNYANNAKLGTLEENLKLIDNINWYAAWSNRVENVPFLAKPENAIYEKVLVPLRKKYLADVAANDHQLMTVAKAQDKSLGNKDTTASIFSKLTSFANKLEVAMYLNDNDKLVDTLQTIDDSISAEMLDKVVAVINTFDPDFRAADTRKALRVINKKYTLKLYDDRDTWEPILSKIRALIDTYNI